MILTQKCKKTQAVNVNVGTPYISKIPNLTDTIMKKQNCRHK